jgi:hypothetical protein
MLLPLMLFYGFQIVFISFITARQAKEIWQNRLFCIYVLPRSQKMKECLKIVFLSLTESGILFWLLFADRKDRTEGRFMVKKKVERCDSRN